MARAGQASAEPGRLLRFTKMHGAGNDFVVLDLRDAPGLAARLSDPADDLCRSLTDRRTGVGCDQVLGIEPPRSDSAVASYRIWNADGSHARQCGNGARCVAAWLVREGLRDGSFVLDSPAGTHAVERDGSGYRVAMGAPAFAPGAIPVVGLEARDGLYSVDLGTDGGRVTFAAASMGNPHAVVEVDDVGRAAVAVVGAALQRHPAFPDSVNVGFAQVLARDRIRLRVYERGVGETRACGSGACAAVAVLARQGRVDGVAGVAVELPGGELHIHYDQAGGWLHMSGPATFVFDGDLLP